MGFDTDFVLRILFFLFLFVGMLFYSLLFFLVWVIRMLFVLLFFRFLFVGMVFVIVFCSFLFFLFCVPDSQNKWMVEVGGEGFCAITPASRVAKLSPGGSVEALQCSFRNRVCLSLPCV